MTNEPNQSASLREKIAAAIEAGEVTMRPKWHFVLKAALGIAGITLILLALLYLISFVIFVLHRTGVWFVPAFGLQGIYALLISLPWILILCAVVFIILLESLVRRYAFAYRQPLVYTVLVIIGLVLLGGFIVAKTAFHDRLFGYAQDERLPIAGGLYRQFGGRELRNVHPGMIINLRDAGFMMGTRRGEPLFVLIASSTQLPFGADFAPGDSVVVFGDRASGTIRAIGIREIESIQLPIPLPLLR